jgi:superfamily II DNA or RNA helicase
VTKTDTITPYPEQQEAIDHHVGVLEQYDATVEGSDTGVGKTIIALGVAKALGLPFLVVAPKSALSAWRDTAERMGVKPEGVVNIEKLKTGNTPWVTREAKKRFHWTLPIGALLIIDEAHRCGGHNTQNAFLIAATKVRRMKVMAVSATIADSPLRLRALGYLLGLHKFTDFYTWASKLGVFRNQWGSLQFTKGRQGEAHMRQLHGNIYPERGHRVSIADLDWFPECETFATAYDLENHTKEVKKIYADLAAEVRSENHDNPLVAMLRARQRAEACKVPLLMDLIQEYVLEENKSVVVFVCFRDTIHRLEEALVEKKFPFLHSKIIGLQTEEERNEEKRKFLDNETRLCLCTASAGGIAIDLDDQHGTHPRISLITPSYSAVELKQVLGRIHRASSKSKAIQYILFAAGTVEEEACKSVRNKVKNLSLLNDGDLTAGIF